ncbi:MAG: hypothetical protein B6D59_03050 [Campylobacteraceae bacterium 4484_4]|nr:MAG: hypothetical protein B6D59_03050 [Campylobacteraceae bacterium 4484_4]
MNRLYLSDLDKTLLYTDLSLSLLSVSVWNRLAAAGIRLSVATARSAPKTLELLKPLRLEHPLIVMDGAMIVSPEGEVLYQKYLDQSTGAAAIEIGRKSGIEPFMIGMDEKGIERFRYGQTNALQQELLFAYQSDRRLQHESDLRPLAENIKIVYIGEKEPLEGIKAEIEERLGESVEIKFAKDPYLEGWFLTLLHPEGDKAHALKQLQEMGYGEHKTTVFGDSHNDLGLFLCADEKIAVANAVEELKVHATKILPHTNDEDAVAKFLKERFSNHFG